MKKKQFKSSYPRYVELEDGSRLNFCSIGCCMDVIAGKWNLLIITELFKGKKRFAELTKAIPEISDKVLTENLKNLVYHAIIARGEDSGYIEYSITAYGTTLRSVLEILHEWGKNHIALHEDKVLC